MSITTNAGVIQSKGGKILIECGCCGCLDDCNARCTHNQTPRIIRIKIHNLALCSGCQPAPAFGGSQHYQVVGGGGTFSGEFDCLHDTQCEWRFIGTEANPGVIVRLYPDGTCTGDYQIGYMSIILRRETTTHWKICIYSYGALLGAYDIDTDSLDCMTEVDGVVNGIHDACGYVTVFGNEYGASGFCCGSLTTILATGGTIDLSQGVKMKKKVIIQICCGSWSYDPLVHGGGRCSDGLFGGTPMRVHCEHCKQKTEVISSKVTSPGEQQCCEGDETKPGKVVVGE